MANRKPYLPKISGHQKNKSNDDILPATASNICDEMSAIWPSVRNSRRCTERGGGDYKSKGNSICQSGNTNKSIKIGLGPLLVLGVWGTQLPASRREKIHLIGKHKNEQLSVALKLNYQPPTLGGATRASSKCQESGRTPAEPPNSQSNWSGNGRAKEKGFPDL